MHRPVKENRDWNVNCRNTIHRYREKIYTSMYMYMYIPHIPSLTLEEGMFKGLKPAFVQWYFPSEQADVPEKWH